MFFVDNERAYYHDCNVYDHSEYHIMKEIVVTVPLHGEICYNNITNSLLILDEAVRRINERKLH